MKIVRYLSRSILYKNYEYLCKIGVIDMIYAKQLFSESDNVLNYTGLSEYDKKLKDYIQNLMAYPVGYIYETMDANFNPNGTFPGTWEEIKDRFLKSSSTEDVGTTGGEEEHRLTLDEMASHRHGYSSLDSGNRERASSGSTYDLVSATSNRQEYTGYAGGMLQSETYDNNGGGVPFSIIPSYLVVKMWRRTA